MPSGSKKFPEENYLAEHAAFERGRIIENESAQKLEYAPNLGLAPYTHAMFLKVREEEENPDYYSTIDRAHTEFLQNATYYFIFTIR